MPAGFVTSKDSLDLLLGAADAARGFDDDDEDEDGSTGLAIKLLGLPGFPFGSILLSGELYYSFFGLSFFGVSFFGLSFWGVLVGLLVLFLALFCSIF